MMAVNNNLLRNNSGQISGNRNLGFISDWEITKSGGNGWTIEHPPVGVADPDGAGPSYCFATSYDQCVKNQMIDLRKINVDLDEIDIHQPDIHVSEWYATRFDCDSTYYIKVSLLNNRQQEMGVFETTINMAKGEKGWKVISHVFKDYGPGVRFINFLHAGWSDLEWAGYYGSKMANAKVEIITSVVQD